MIFVKKLIKKILICASVYFISVNTFADPVPDVQVNAIPNPCVGNFLNIIDRPSNSDSVCPVASGATNKVIQMQNSV